MSESIYTKQALVKFKLAQKLADYKVGDRLPTIGDLTEEFECSRGLTQNALNMLEERDAVKIQKRGVLGSFLLAIDYLRLWQESGQDYLIGLSPLPYTKRHEGLATAIYQLMDREEIKLHLAYLQGATVRADALLNGRAHFATMAENSARLLVEEHDRLEILLNLHDGSYLSGYAIYYNDPEWRNFDVLRVAYDPDSPDHAKLIMEYFGEKYQEEHRQKVEFMPIPYTRMAHELEAGVCDVSIFNKDNLSLRLPDIKISRDDIPLSEEEKRGTRASIVICKDNRLVANLLRSGLDIEELKAIQDKVVSGELPPIY